MLWPRPMKYMVEDAVKALGKPSSLYDIYFQIQRAEKLLYDLGAIKDTAHALVADGVFIWHEPDNMFNLNEDKQLYLF